MTRFALKAITSAIAVTAALGAADATAQTKYSAEVRRTSFGIAHIKANDFGSAGYGVGESHGEATHCSRLFQHSLCAASVVETPHCPTGADGHARSPRSAPGGLPTFRGKVGHGQAE